MFWRDISGSPWKMEGISGIPRYTNIRTGQFIKNMPENNKTEEFLQKLAPCIERGELEACVEEAAR
jgi:hypothetical protein